MRDAAVRYALFLAETVTLVAAVVGAVGLAAFLLSRQTRAGRDRPTLELKHLNRRFDDLARAARDQLLPAPAVKAARKQDRRREKERARDERAAAAGPATPGAPTTADGPAGTGGPFTPSRPRVFVLDFHGDLRASQVSALREEITAVLLAAVPGDEVLLRLENPGGAVHEQGLAASQLQRLRDHGIPLTVAVDTIAASGGYLMACVAQRILAAPFAIVGSIGVIDQLPNFHRLLDRHGIDYEQFKGGEQKRTVTMFTRTTDEDRARRSEQVHEVHELFQQFVAEHRPGLDLAEVATGRYWYGTQALRLGLVDELTTSDDYLLARREQADLYLVSSGRPRTLRQRLARRTSALLTGTADLAARLPGPLPG